MTDIQIDMFEVQLGSAILLQLRVDGRTVRILSDAGVKASEYQKDHVLQKLLPILRDAGALHIDLLIGTHYDEDHLNGLVPIIDHEEITIGEAWMPPVANDADSAPVDRRVGEGDLLAHQLAGDGGSDRLATYLAAKRVEIETVRAVVATADVNQHSLLASDYQGAPLGAASGQGDEIYFRAALRGQKDSDECEHASDTETEQSPEIAQAIASAKSAAPLEDPYWLDRSFALDPSYQSDIAKRIAQASPGSGKAQQQSLSEIVRSSAKDAINALALHAVVTALRKKGVPVRTEIIEDGEPRRYAWNSSASRFMPAARRSAQPVLTLLGPSRSLVQKHWHRLPVEKSIDVALRFVVPIKSITPSNQLSYIFRVEHEGQGILICGDAGCVDFKKNREEYYPKLLEKMIPLHVLQVAHHAGNNAHFYRVLEAAGYPEQVDPSFLLLSHATDDRYRPSEEFRLFLLGTLDRGDDVQLLSTSKPKAEKVIDFVHAFHPVVGTQGDRGDVRVAYSTGQGWSVLSHAVAP